MEPNQGIGVRDMRDCHIVNLKFKYCAARGILTKTVMASKHQYTAEDKHRKK
jgi:hypothetical protein